VTEIVADGTYRLHFPKDKANSQLYIPECDIYVHEKPGTSSLP